MKKSLFFKIIKLIGILIWKAILYILSIILGIVLFGFIVWGMGYVQGSRSEDSDPFWLFKWPWLELGEWRRKRFEDRMEKNKMNIID